MERALIPSLEVADPLRRWTTRCNGDAVREPGEAIEAEGEEGG